MPTDEPFPFDTWIATLKKELDLPEDFTIDVALVLDLARDAAHGIARPAAPLTTFLVGLAAGRAGGSTEDVQRAAQAAIDALQKG